MSVVIGFDGIWKVEWQGLLGEAEAAEAGSGISFRVVASTEATTRGEQRSNPAQHLQVVLRNQKLEQGKHKGLSLDPQRNHHFQNQNQNQNNQFLSSSHVVEEEEEEHHQQYLQQAQDLHQNLLYQRLDTQSSPPVPSPKKRSYFPSSSSLEQSVEHATLREKMEDDHRNTASRLGLRHTGGEIVEVQGGHIVRSTGRKDRHSKVCTAKGPRDRRVRLSAHTAIQFYDVQDRLGYDRPSKAVDWLIKKAKSAIDELAELPAWKPTTGSTQNTDLQQQDQHQHQQQQQQHLVDIVDNETNNHNQMGNANESNPSFLPPSMDSESIADTIKSLFPMGASAGTNSSPMQFHQTFPPPDLLSRTNSQSQDLRLTLQFQDPMLLYHNQQDQHQNHQNEQSLFSNPTPLGFDGSGWSENHASAEIGRFQRMFAWNAGGDTAGGAFMFNSPPLCGQTQLFSQRGPLQSSNPPSVRAWMEPPQPISTSTTDHHHPIHPQHHQSLPFHPSSIPGFGFASQDGFSRFRIPARIQGEQEEHDGISDKPSSASSDSRH